MNTNAWKYIALAVILSAVAAPLWAHHGDAGRYDEALVTLNGSVVELQMINPHSIVVLDVPDASGKVTRWQAEMGGPNALARGFGWTRNTLKPGDLVLLCVRVSHPNQNPDTQEANLRRRAAEQGAVVIDVVRHVGQDERLVNRA